MCSVWRTLGVLEPATLRDIGLVCVADVVVGASFGAIAVSGGLPAWQPVLMSLVVFAGGAQFAAVGVVLAGGTAWAGVLAGLVLNARMLPFGFAVSDALGERRAARLVGAHLIIDESVAFAMRYPDRTRRRVALWTCGVALFECWNLAVMAGASAGEIIHDTDAFGLDAAFPAVLLALVLPALTDGDTRRAALVGAGLAVVSAMFLPPGLPVLVALAGLAVPLVRRRRPTEAAQAPATEDLEVR